MTYIEKVKKAQAITQVIIGISVFVIVMLDIIDYKVPDMVKRTFGIILIPSVCVYAYATVTLLKSDMSKVKKIEEDKIKNITKKNKKYKK